MLKYLEKLKLLWKFSEETYNCNLGVSNCGLSKFLLSLGFLGLLLNKKYMNLQQALRAFKVYKERAHLF